MKVLLPNFIPTMKEAKISLIENDKGKNNDKDKNNDNYNDNDIDSDNDNPMKVRSYEPMNHPQIVTLRLVLKIIGLI